jgi:hypothetical protein
MLNARRQPFLGRTSRVNREVYARFCEGLGGEIPPAYSAMWWCAGINRHGIEDERDLRGRSSDPLGPEFCAVRCEASGEA